ncbi:probable phytoene dehydrogenase AL-1 (carotenoid biosynthesis protein al-1) [Fusarium torulosum]|uniref:Phytoene desaturase n=1 Tax=Fusarium torulosum TaxID=33205 RepID=A0AAE8M4V8_9HYPO|nr:probable phytoene dehydrogenase AL-1 (carotenoid biosynthesis protein al-1) [Fusarium torulosum]
MSDIKQQQKSVIVIGAGVGGVSTAARLAKAGFKVTIVEKNDFTGGRCSLIHHDGYRFDQGPSLLLLPRFFHEIFQDLGTSLTAEGVELLKCEPNYNIWFGDGSSFEMSTDLTKMKKAIEAVEGIDGFERYLGFLQESHRHYEVSVESVLRRNFPSIWSLARPEVLLNLFNIHPLQSIWTRASKYFYTERLRRVFTFGSMYMGMSPFDAPGTYSLLQYTELAEGILYPRGGFHKVVEALVNVGERLGVEYRLSTGVKSISIDQASGKANGVVLDDGTHLASDIVISNADLVYTYNNLLPKTSYADSLSKRETSCSSISFYWSASKIVPELNAHNIFLADEYQESFDSIFKEHLIPSHPSFYVNVPSRIDPSAAPDGKDSIVVLVPVGHLLSDSEGTHRGLSKSGNSDLLSSGQDWEKMISLARDTVIETMRARIGVDLTPLIEHEIINTPFTWQEKFNLDKGAILGLSHSIMNVLAFRPGTQHSKYKNLYFAGASTHPGTGVPVCIAGSKIVAEQILRDSGFKSHQIPWAKDTSKSPKSGLDKLHDSSLTLFHAFLGALVAMLLAYYYMFIATN